MQLQLVLEFLLYVAHAESLYRAGLPCLLRSCNLFIAKQVSLIIYHSNYNAFTDEVFSQIGIRTLRNSMMCLRNTSKLYTVIAATGVIGHCSRSLYAPNAVSDTNVGASEYLTPTTVSGQ